jgi:hypothetical protein
VLEQEPRVHEVERSDLVGRQGQRLRVAGAELDPILFAGGPGLAFGLGALAIVALDADDPGVRTGALRQRPRHLPQPCAYVQDRTNAGKVDLAQLRLVEDVLHARQTLLFGRSETLDVLAAQDATSPTDYGRDRAGFRDAKVARERRGEG